MEDLKLTNTEQLPFFHFRVVGYGDATVKEMEVDVQGLLTAQLAKLQPALDQDIKLRILAWELHPCQGKYGDDGELQCNRCFGQGEPIDFKRASWERIIRLSAVHETLCRDEARKEELERIIRDLKTDGAITYLNSHQCLNKKLWAIPYEVWQALQGGKK